MHCNVHDSSARDGRPSWTGRIYNAWAAASGHPALTAQFSVRVRGGGVQLSSLVGFFLALSVFYKIEYIFDLSVPFACTSLVTGVETSIYFSQIDSGWSAYTGVETSIVFHTLIACI